MKPKTGPQDLPPKGGYAPFQIDRLKLRNLLGGRLGIGLLVSTHVVGWYGYLLSWRDARRSQIEQLSTQLATFPILYAEKDRAMLKHIKHLRDVEEEIMEDFPHWEVGTYFGVPVYESVPKNVYVEPFPVTRYIGINNAADIPYEVISRLLF